MCPGCPELPFERNVHAAASRSPAQSQSCKRAGPCCLCVYRHPTIFPNGLGRPSCADVPLLLCIWWRVVSARGMDPDVTCAHISIPRHFQTPELRWQVLSQTPCGESCREMLSPLLGPNKTAITEVDGSCREIAHIAIMSFALIFGLLAMHGLLIVQRAPTPPEFAQPFE